MPKTALSLILATLVACSGGDKDDTDTGSGELSGTNGTIDGSIDYGDENVTFASGIAFGNSFFHDDRDVIILTAWGENSCDSTDSFEWETSGEGYKLDVPNDGEDITTEGTLWDCTVDENYGGGCGGVDYPAIDLVFDVYDRTRGGQVKGTMTLGSATDDFLAGTLEFDLIFCGED